MRQQAKEAYHKSSINLDQKNACSVNGKSQKKWMSIYRAVTETMKALGCKVKLMIGAYSNSYFVVGGAGGSSCHEGHPPVNEEDMPSQKRHLTDEAVQHAKVMAIHGTHPGLVSAVIKESYAVSMMCCQPSSLIQHAKLASSLIGIKNLEKYQHCMSNKECSSI